MSRANLQKLIVPLLLFAACTGLSMPASAQLKPVDAVPADEQWVNRFIAYMNTGESHKDLLHERRLVGTALRPFQLDAQQLRQFNRGGLDRIMLESMRQMLTTQNGGFTFLRFRTIDGTRTALFRLTSDSGMNYVEWFLETMPDGKTLSWDYNSFATGELASESLRRMWTPMVAKLDPEIKKHMGKTNRDLAEHFDDVTGIRHAFLAQDYEKAITLFNKLPKSLQENKLTMLLVSNVYYHSGDEEAYAEMLERFAEAHPDASNLELVYLDYYFVNERFDDVLRMVESLDRRVGTDIYLNVYRANVAYQKGDYAKACRLIDAGLAEDRRMEDFYWSSIEHALAEEDWPRVSQMLTGVESIGVELVDLTQAQGYEGYVASEEFKLWQAVRKPVVPDE